MFALTYLILTDAGRFIIHTTTPLLSVLTDFKAFYFHCIFLSNHSYVKACNTCEMPSVQYLQIQKIYNLLEKTEDLM